MGHLHNHSGHSHPHSHHHGKANSPSRRAFLTQMISAAVLGPWAVGQQSSRTDMAERFRQMSEDYERKGLADPFKGITTNGTCIPDLFSIAPTGVSTDPMRIAAEKFISTLSSFQVSKTMFPIDDEQWRKWMNQHFYVRQGLGFLDMNDEQREAAFGLMRASLSTRGMELTRNVMRLNETLAEMTDDHDFLGEWFYFISIFGLPSPTQPWGWQLSGHHAIVNYFVLGDQVVATPFFFGSEPVKATSGKYKGIEILQKEQNDGLAMLKSLPAQKQKAAVLEFSKTGNNNLTEAFKDNVVFDYAGLRGMDMEKAERLRLRELIQLYVGNMSGGHARVKMDEVDKHLENTWFAWVGSAQPDSVFYYRVQSPVILIEFDHQKPANLRGMMKDTGPNQQHIHCVIRTPNGNDYGKDLLRQHYLKHPQNHT